VHHVLDALTDDEKQRIRLVVVLGASSNAPGLYNGQWELVYRTDPGHMDGPRALLGDLVASDSERPRAAEPMAAAAALELEAAGPLPSVPAQPAQNVFSIADITAVMRQHSCQIDYGNDRVNICYCEGTDLILPDAKTFKLNRNRPNAFDSLRIVFQGDTSENMKILGMWSATTHAGLYYEKRVLLNPGGAFHIAVGRQSAWRYGIYHHCNYPALLNTEPL
jgi:hypothetical protein